MIDVGGYRIHMSCLGNGRPTVVLLHGLGDYSFDWILVQRRLAAHMRVCAYDRPAQAWSDVGPPPRGLETSSLELRRLVLKSGLHSPLILVGHSWGGMIARVYAYEHPRDVADMVLVDSTDEREYLWINGKVVQPLAMSEADWSELMKPHASDAGAPGGPPSGPPHASGATSLPPIHAPFDHLPSDVQNIRRWAMSLAMDGGAFRGGDTTDIRQDFIFMNKLDKSRTHPFGCMPLIVLAKTPDRDNDSDYSPDQLKWNAGLQKGLAALSSKGILVIAPASGHHIQLDQPALVAHAVEDVIKEARAGTSSRCTN
jgi:pimeloyl-ACP methyl ester carboxylesterase